MGFNIDKQEGWNDSLCYTVSLLENTLWFANLLTIYVLLSYVFKCAMDLKVIAHKKGWPPFGHESIEHEPLTALEQESL